MNYVLKYIYTHFAGISVIAILFIILFKLSESPIDYNILATQKWGTKETSEAYRFGDIFTGYIFDNAYNDNNPNYLKDIGNNYPESFGHKYVTYSGYPESYRRSDYKLLAKIFSEYSYDKPDDETLVIHLRLGDVLDTSNPDYSKYYYDIDYYHELLRKISTENIRKIDLVTGLHKNVYVEESNRRLHKIRNIFDPYYPVRVKITNDPDKDLYYMCHSKYFARSGRSGEFSKIISEYVRMNPQNIVYEK
tara:strand:- start:647 stop:1393 length:747 start_codon:yes stop_codon:yes gene_type:complete